MKHVMKLRSAPFSMIKSGKKTIELRLYDEKRQRISVGDEIEFISMAEESQSLHCRVEKLHIFDSFSSLYQQLPLLQCGYTEKDIKAASPSDMESYYSKVEQARYGVVGIEIKLI